MGMAEPAVLCGINQETANESLKMINEAELIEESAGKLLAQLDELIKDGIIGSSSAILFFNDSSTDATEERLIPHMGFPSDIVYFDVRPREKGESKYTFSKMLALALNGITSLSERPIRVISCLGILMSLFAVLMIAYSIYMYIGGGNISGFILKQRDGQDM